MKGSATHLASLESESIHIIREVVVEAQNPVMLFSAGKDSAVMAHLAIRAFYPRKPPFPLLHVDSTWEVQSLIAFRDAFAREHGFQLIAYANADTPMPGLKPPISKRRVQCTFGPTLYHRSARRHHDQRAAVFKRSHPPLGLFTNQENFYQAGGHTGGSDGPERS